MFVLPVTNSYLTPTLHVVKTGQHTRTFQYSATTTTIIVEVDIFTLLSHQGHKLTLY